ncbi:MAG: L-rhamnose isomerase [Kiritimatiellaeota bacterium]|nr:L-rhamnose isomerase [Kiritimatiellota bacterium]
MTIHKAYLLAREQYAAYGSDTTRALKQLAAIRLSLHCWQGDDVAGFEPRRGNLGGVLPTGNYPGRARTPEELRTDLAKALSLIPGRHRVNLHAVYAETRNRPVDRDELEPQHFAGWVAWARAHKLGLDFNGSFFSHPLAESGRTLSHPDRAIRRFWIDHARACRRIGAFMGRQLKTPCVTNIWVPDGSKDTPADRKGPRELLRQSLDAIFKESYHPVHNLDALEGKLFGLGSEAYVVGSHDFYLAYAVAHRKLLCLDTGHFHPTESVSDKLSAVLSQLDQVLLHVSRGVRWDSDHVVTLTDDLRSLAEEIVRGNYLPRVHIGLDFFDASINRVAAWVIGARAMLQALLIALLEPTATLRQLERQRDFTARLALMEELKNLPFGAVWDYYCLQQDVPANHAWMRTIKAYEAAVQSKRH